MIAEVGLSVVVLVHLDRHGDHIRKSTAAERIEGIGSV
jgi:hypothetical protein